MIKIIFGIIIGVVVMYFVYELIMLLSKLATKTNEAKQKANETQEELWRKNLEIDRLKNVLDYELKKKENEKKITRRRK